MASFEHVEPEFGRTASRESPGRRLRRARERRELTTAAVADALHLERRMVEALEAEDYDVLPPATFVRGYLRAYARHVGVPESEVVQAYDGLGLEEARPLTPTVGSVRRGAGLVGMAWVGLIVLAGVVGGGWLAWDRGLVQMPTSLADLGIPTGGDEVSTADAGTVGEPAADEPLTAEVESPPAAAPADGQTASQASEPAASDEEAPTGAAGATALTSRDANAAGSTSGGEPDAGTEPGGAATSLPDVPLGTVEPDLETQSATAMDEPATEPLTDLAAEEPGAAADSAESSVPEVGTGAAGTEDALSGDLGTAGEAASASDFAGPETTDSLGDAGTVSDNPAPTGPRESLSFRFTGESWMEVTDARGEHLIRGLISDPGTRTVAGVPPFTVVIGDVTRVSVSREGEPVNLDPYTHDKVARFTLSAE